MAVCLNEVAKARAQQWARENIITTWDDVNQCTYFIISNWIEDPDEWYERQAEWMKERSPA